MGSEPKSGRSPKRKKGTTDLLSALGGVQDAAMNIGLLINQLIGKKRNADEAGIQEDSVWDNNCLDMISKLEGRINVLRTDTATPTETVLKRIKVMQDQIEKVLLPDVIFINRLNICYTRTHFITSLINY